MKTFIAVHHHRHGESLFLFQSESDWAGATHGPPTGNPDKNAKLLADELDIDYEPEKYEWIEVTEMNLNQIPTVP